MKALRLLACAVPGFAVVLALGPVAARTAPPAGAQAQTDLRVRIERVNKVGRTPLWVPIRVTVTQGDAARPPSVDHVVFAAARNSRGDQAGPFTLGVLELDDPAARGVHEGFVIVPYGGPWTLTAVVDKAQPDPLAPPIVLGRGTAEVTVDAPVPAAGTVAPATGASGNRKPQSEPFGVAVLWVHSMVGVGWGVAVALLALLALPAGRRFLSEHGTTTLDGNLGRIIRATWWLTGLVVATGIYNLVKSVAYRVPLSPDQARRLFRLPYAEPYYVALAVKLAAYAVMIGATVPLIAEARRRAADAETGAGRAGPPEDDPSPWENRDRLPADLGPGGRLALRRKLAVAVDDSWLTPERAAGRVRALVAVMLVGGAVIMAAVTLLKYFHLLGELTRLSG